MSGETYWNSRKWALMGAAYIIDEATVLAWEPGEAVDVKRIIFIMTEAKDGTAAVITVAKRRVDGSTNSADLGTFTIPASQAINTVLYGDFAKPAGVSSTLVDGSIGHTALPDMPAINPGWELVITSDAGGATGQATVYVEYQGKGFIPPNLADPVPLELAFTAA